MGKRFVTRSRQAWQALLAPETVKKGQLHASANAWLTTRLEGYVQSNPDAPITLAVPDRFLDILGDAPAKQTADATDRQGVAM